MITGIDDIESIPLIIREIVDGFFDFEKKIPIPGIDHWNSIKRSASMPYKNFTNAMASTNSNDSGNKKSLKYSNNLGNKKTLCKTPLSMKKKDASKAKDASAAGACKAMKKVALIALPGTKQRKKNTETDLLFVNPPDDTYAPYFNEFEGKRAPNFTAVEDLVLFKGYAAVSEDHTVGTDQTAESFWGKFLRASSCSLDMW